MFEGVNEDIEVWPQIPVRPVSWLGRFVNYLKFTAGLPI